MKAVLIRRETGDTGTFGTLEVEGLTLHTVELAWRKNARSTSCIPCNVYQVVRWDSPSKGDCFKVQNVPGRDDILIHVGNTIRDFEGCIGVGRGRGTLNELPAVTGSRNAMGDLRAIAPDGFSLNIVSLCAEDFV